MADNTANLSETIIAERTLIEAMTRTACATEQLTNKMNEFTSRIENLEKAMHSPPCPRLENVCEKVIKLEEGKERFTATITEKLDRNSEHLTEISNQLNKIVNRVDNLEKSNGRFNDIFWKVVAALMTAAALAMWKVGG